MIVPLFPTVVVDTNVWVSFLIWPSDVIRSAIHFAIHQSKIIASDSTIDELIATLNKEKFNSRISTEEKHSFCADVSHISTIISITASVNACRDPRDNMFLELALSGNAEIIITGDDDLLALHPWRNISILTPRQFVEAMRS